MNIPIIYEDNWLVVVDKPSGLLVIPTPRKEPRTLTTILNDDLALRGKLYRLHPCHRLDRETSGLLIYAKGKSIQRRMMQLFKERKIRKTYIVFIRGNLPTGEGKIILPVEGREALTAYRVLERRKEFSVLEVVPQTGRTNQIRIHFEALAHPVLGETKYAFRRDFKIKAKRLCLHAKAVEFPHPITGKDINLSIGFPKEMKEVLAKNV